MPVSPVSGLPADTGGTATAMTIVMGILAAAAFVAAAAALYVRHLMTVIDGGGFVSDSDGHSATDFASLMSLITFGLFLTAYVLFWVWSYQVTRNAWLTAGRPLQWRPVWAVVGWLIPVANWVLPYLTLLDVAGAVRPPGAPESPYDRDTRRAIIGWWAVGVPAYVVCGIIELVYLGQRSDAAELSDVDAVRHADEGFLLTYTVELFISILLLLLVIRLVRGITRSQRPLVQSRLAAYQQAWARQPWPHQPWGQHTWPPR